MTSIRFSDQDIRPVLRDRILASHLGDPSTVLLEELGICSGLVRIDMALVNGKIHAYEIKSDRDKLDRLRTQVELYSKVVDRATLVTSERHLPAAEQMIPSWWGIQKVTASSAGAPVLKTLRRGRLNPSREARALVELLWLEDALELLEAHSAVDGFRSKPRRFVWDRVCETVELQDIAAAVREKLKARPLQRGLLLPS